jgi:hypothetical protein
MSAHIGTCGEGVSEITKLLQAMFVIGYVLSDTAHYVGIRTPFEDLLGCPREPRNLSYHRRGHLRVFPSAPYDAEEKSVQLVLQKAEEKRRRKRLLRLTKKSKR